MAQLRIVHGIFTLGAAIFLLVTRQQGFAISASHHIAPVSFALLVLAVRYCD